VPLLRVDRLPSAPPEPHPALSPELVIEAVAPVLSDQRRRRIERVARQRLWGVTVVLERLYDPHNGAAVLRTCEALGLLHVHVVEGGEAFRFSRKVSTCAHHWLNVYIHPSIERCVAWLRRRGFACWATVPPDLVRGAGGPGAAGAGEGGGNGAGGGGATGARPVALMFGNEHAGLTAEAIALSDRRLTIPMQGFTESLNLSVSAALALHPAVARRRAYLGRPGDLTGAGLNRLRAAYYAQSTAHAAPLILRHLARGGGAPGGPPSAGPARGPEGASITQEPRSAR